eukprot:s282_g1.t1
MRRNRCAYVAASLLALCCCSPSSFVGSRMALPRPPMPSTNIHGKNEKVRVAREAFVTPAIPLVGAALLFLGFQALNTEVQQGAAGPSTRRDWLRIQVVDVTPDMDISKQIASGETHRPVLRGKSAKDVHWYALSEEELPPVKWFIRGLAKKRHTPMAI